MSSEPLFEYLDAQEAEARHRLHAPGPVRFTGAVYQAQHDKARLTGQILRVFECMKDGRYRTLDEISAVTGDPHASISAQLRHMRKEHFGAHTVNKRARGDRSHGLFEYQLIVNEGR